MAIKKVVMYVNISDEELLDDDYYGGVIDDKLKGFFTSAAHKEVLSDVAEEELNLSMASVFTDNPYIDHWAYRIEEPSETDKEDSEYQALTDALIKRN